MCMNICEYYAILYEGVEKPKVYVSTGICRTDLHGYSGTNLTVDAFAYK